MKTIIYHTAPWCAPCKQTKPIAKRLAAKAGVDFREINVDVEKPYIDEIRGVPTVVVVENAKIAKILGPAEINPRTLNRAILGDPDE